uniref:Uncharacterized protein n=1 Tax=Rhizophora mucronata TaxID=61149 RepID=A0A2P2PZA0_RHIMU
MGISHTPMIIPSRCFIPK